MPRQDFMTTSLVYYWLGKAISESRSMVQIGPIQIGDLSHPENLGLYGTREAIKALLTETIVVFVKHKVSEIYDGRPDGIDLTQRIEEIVVACNNGVRYHDNRNAASFAKLYWKDVK